MTRLWWVHDTLSLLPAVLLVGCGGSSQRDPPEDHADAATVAAGTGGSLEHQPDAAAPSGATGGSFEQRPDAAAPSGGTGGSFEHQPDAAAPSGGTGGSVDGGDASVEASLPEDGAAEAGSTDGAAPVTPAMPTECQVPGGSGAVAGSITFELDNRSSGPIYVDQCAQVPQVHSCADGYTEPVEYLPAFNTISCATGEGYCGGGGCENNALARETGVTELVAWNAVLYTYDLAPGPRLCTCYWESPAPSGKYRATLKIYESADPLQVINSDTEGKLLSVDFVVPDDDGVVTFEYSG